MEILTSLEESPVVQRHQVLDFKTFENGWYYKVKATLKDGSVLHAREYAGAEERNYAFHWQDKQNRLRVRWDNAPHHEHIPTYPHHKHVGDEVQPSVEISLDDALEYIEDRLL